MNGSSGTFHWANGSVTMRTPHRGFHIGRAALQVVVRDAGTELYHTSAANVGNPDLRPERSWSYELGADRQSEFVTIHPSVFSRDGTDLLGWAPQF